MKPNKMEHVITVATGIALTVLVGSFVSYCIDEVNKFKERIKQDEE